MLDLNQIHLATEEDKVYRIGYWAKLFKAKTWEDLNMLAQKTMLLKKPVKPYINSIKMKTSGICAKCAKKDTVFNGLMRVF